MNGPFFLPGASSVSFFPFPYFRHPSYLRLAHSYHPIDRTHSVIDYACDKSRFFLVPPLDAVTLCSFLLDSRPGVIYLATEARRAIGFGGVFGWGLCLVGFPVVVLCVWGVFFCFGVSVPRSLLIRSFRS